MINGWRNWVLTFRIIIPVYNAEQWISKCLESLINQKYKDWKAVVIDDNSNDGTLERIKTIIKTHNISSQFKVLKRTNNVGALENIVYGINILCDSDDQIVVLLDGDDWFYDVDVLDYLNEIYSKEDIWMTYGSFISESGSHNNFCKHIKNTDNYRKSNWVTSHLRTFKYGLWKQVNDRDLRDSYGKYFSMAWDMAIMYPLIEMCGMNRIKFIDKILYVYNDINPINDFKKSISSQLMMANEIRNKKPYNKVNI